MHDLLISSKRTKEKKDTIELSHPCVGSTWEWIRMCHLLTTKNFYVIKKEKENAALLYMLLKQKSLDEAKLL